MKIRFFYLAVLILILLLPACVGGGREESPIIAEINGFKLTQAEFLQQLAAELEFDSDFKLTKAAKKVFLEQIVRRELLIQEAQRLRLDRQKKFVRAIERYWESTLIRDLLEVKGEQIEKTVIVSQQDAASRYAQLQSAGGYLPPLAESRNGIVVELREEKKAQMMNQWMDALRKNADVTIDEGLLYKN